MTVLCKVSPNQRLVNALMKVGAATGSRTTFISTKLMSTETKKIPSRSQMIAALASAKEYDMLIIGGGATGAGAALDAAKRGMKVACVEREDFGAGTSSRSTKLIWGGSRYLVQAFVSVMSSKLFTSPGATVKRFVEDFKMVLNCHRERTFLLQRQPHLTSWLPIAVPLSKWIQWPPPFGFTLASLGPLGLFPLFFKFYDALSGFSCPPSHVMTPARSRRKFPQLANNVIKYCSVFYEGIHDDARTNLAVALTAAREGADMANYCEVVSLLRNRDIGVVDDAQRVVGAIVRDHINGQQFAVRAQSVLFCGGPFTDELRALEDPACRPAVTGASGVHIVLPGYFAPASIGLVDMNTSDGRFLFFLPWGGQVLVGTTDHVCEATMRPVPRESEILWLLSEASKYISPELKLRRQDVMSAWAGIRPLASDPNAKNTAAVSRDHLVSHNADTGVVFVSGGKWTTYREMAEDAVDKLIEVTPALRALSRRPCETLTTDLVGLQGYSVNLERTLIQEYAVSVAVAQRLAKAYGGRAHDVLRIALEDQSDAVNHSDGRDRLLLPGFPFLEAEVVFAARHDWAHRPEDFLARRTRLAFLDKDAAIRAIPRVVELLAAELRWSAAQQSVETDRCVEFMRHFGGPKPRFQEPSSVRMAPIADLKDVFRKVDLRGRKAINRQELQLASEMLNRPLPAEQLDDCMSEADADGTLTFDKFSAWWNGDRHNPALVKMREDRAATAASIEGSGTLFG